MISSLPIEDNTSNQVKKLALIVDDSNTARQLLKKLLESYGHEVLCAESAEVAIQLLNQTQQPHPDVIFMDHSMPGMDGLQALKAIKANPCTAMIPILMYTSQGGAVYAEQAKRFGAVGIIPKELKHVALKQVLDTLDKIITRSKQDDADFSSPETSTTDPISFYKPADKKQSETVNTAETPAHLHTANNPPPLLTQAVENRFTSVPKPRIQDTAQSSFTAGISHSGTFKKPLPPTSGPEENSYDQSHKKHLMDAIKLLHQQVQDIQTQNQHSQQLLQKQQRRLSRWLMALSCCVALGGFLIWQPTEDQSPAQSLLTDNKASDASASNRPFSNNSISNSSTGKATIPGKKLSLLETVSQFNTRSSETVATNKKDLAQQTALLQSLVNQNVPFNFNMPPFDDQQAKTVENLLKLLPTLGFSGTIQLTAYFTDYCVTEKNGGWQLAEDALPIEQCQFFSINNTNNLESQTVGFSNLLNSTNTIDAKIKLAVTLQDDNSDSKPDKSSVKTAGKWNQLINRYNHIEYQLLPAE